MNHKTTRKTKVLFALLMMLMTTVGNVWAQTTPTVTMGAVEEITATTAIGHGNVTSQGTVTERGFCWNTAANPTIAENLYYKSGSGTGDFTADITGLTPNRTYYVRAYAVAGTDTTYSAQEQTFQTQVQVVTTVDVIHIRTNYAVGVGKVVSGSYGGTVTERGVCYTSSSTNHTPHINDSDVTHISSGAGVGNYSVEMTGLEENTNYYLRTYAIVTDGDEIDTVYGEKKVFNTHVHMQNGTVEVGDGEFVFTDSESRDGWYDHNEDYTLVFIPSNPSNGVKIDFNSMLINNDFLYIYDGDISTSNLIGVFTCNDYHAYKHSGDPDDSPISVFGMGGADGNGKIFTVTSHSHMTLRFVSDYRWRDAGWTAHVSQAPFTPQPPTIAKTACTNNEFVLLRTSKGQHSTTLKYDIAFGGEEPETPNTIYTGPINIGNGEYPVKISVMTEIMETADSSRFSETKTYIFGDESLVIPPYQPTIVRNGNTSSVTISVVRPADLNDTWSIKYTLDGTDPATSATAQVISYTTEDEITEEVTTIGTVDLPDFCTVKAVTQGTTCPDIYSDTTEFEYTCGVDSQIKLLPPTITFNGNGNTATTTITPSTDGCTILYIINDNDYDNDTVTYEVPFTVFTNDRVKAWVTKADTVCYDDSEPAIRTYLPGGDNPGSGSGLFGDVVYLDDREPHSLSYYSDGDQPVHSLHPADVKITYFGNGTGTVSTTDGPTPASNSWTADATGVQVGPGAPGNQFVYFETLEAGGYSIDNSGYINLEPDYDGANHDYPYSLIPNPFSVRPTYTTVTTTRNIYVRGTVQDYANGYIDVTYTDVNNAQRTWSGRIYYDGHSIFPEANLEVLTGTTLSFSLFTDWAQQNNNNAHISCEIRYDDANGEMIWNPSAYGNNGQNNPVTGSTTVQEGGSSGGTITNTDYRGFYAWRVKRLKGVTIEDAYGKSYDVDSIIPAETRLLFHTENEYNNEVDFEALWAKAYVVESNTESGLNANVSYERNFVVGVTNIGTNSLTVPVTYSSYYPDGTQGGYTGNVTIGNFTCRADTKFEYMNLRFGNIDWGGFNPSNDIALTADNHYFCLGRGLNIDEDNTPNRVEGIPNANQNDLKYTIRVESGKYNRLSFVRDNDNRRIISGRYLVKGIMGCDYDRAQNVNDNLIFGNNPNFTPDNYNNDVNNRIFLSYGMSFTGTQNLDRQTFDLVVKSGQYQPQFWYNGGNGRHSRSFYVGQNNAGNVNDGNSTVPGVRYIVVEGGMFGSMNGGRGTDYAGNATPDTVVSSIRIKGGTFHGSVFGAAADNESPGSRRIVITRGQVEGWIAGGCNGTGQQAGSGSTNGDSYIYVGGEAIIGREGEPLIVNTTPGGNVFGAGRGLDTRYTSINNSYVVVADNSYVYNDVYGGGYHGYITTQANVYIIGGTVGNHVFGGAYDHGHTPPIPATRVYVRGGLVKGSVHGGSNTRGNIGNNNAIIEMTGGTVGTGGSFVDGKVFGGGLGANADVLSNTFVTISGGLVVNNVYGGGNEGSVGIRNNNATGKATVTIQGGQIGDIHSDTNPTKGNVYGGGKGLAHQAILTDPNKTTVNETEVNIIGSNIMGSVFGGGENGFVYTNTLVTVEGGQVGGYPGETSGGEHQDCDNPYHGSVYGGGSGMNFANGEVVQCYPEDGWVMGNSTVNIVSGAHVMRNVYGGSNVASVGQFQTDGNGNASIDAFGYYIPTPNTGLATVNISGGIIGTTGTDYDAQGHAKGLANGMVYGGTHGRAILSDQDFMKFANVNNTHVIIAAGADIRGSVFGGGEDGRVLDSTFVEIIDGTIGATLTAEENLVNPDGSGMTIFRGNVYGGGRGLDSIRPSGSSTYVLIKGAGFVKNNTRVLVTGGLVRHNVYGGGSLASVGIPDEATTGRATVIIRGGQVGTSGANNGSVFGSGRGMPVKQNSAVDYSEFAFVKNSFVTIEGSAKVLRSVFGGGENGHVRQKTKVDIKGGTIGITNKNVDFFKYAGNVYGGGRGVDHTNAYTYGISPTAGKVNVETEVNVTGGTIYRSVYGGGSMASVGEVMKDNNGNNLYFYYDENGEQSTTNPDATGVPADSYLKHMTGTGYENNGNTHVVISGGEIGIDGYENGHVFGSARGLSGSKYRHLSYTGKTDVRITGNANVHGSVFGSGEDGHVLKDTYVLIEANCVIGTNGHTGYEGNVYGGGRGLDLDDTHHLSPTAGKTVGNTVVDVTSGWVKGSVFGGGRLASVGIEEEIPDSNGEYHTGHTQVTISGGEIGTLTSDHPDETIGGNVYGGGKGFAGATYKYFTYTKNTHVIIKDNAKIHGSVFGSGEDGHTRQTTLVDIEGGTIGDRESVCTDRYHGNVYGGGRGIDTDGAGNFSWTAGRTNWSTQVNVKGGRVFRNVYGGGNIASVGMVLIDPDEDTVMLRPNGISTRAPYDVVPIDKFGHPRYTYTKNSNDSIIWATDPNPLYGIDPTTGEYSDDNLTGWARVNITGGIVGSIEDQDHEHGNVFGSCHGKAGIEYQHLSYVINTDVHVDYGQDLDQGDANNIIQGSVFGGGEDGHVNMNTKVTVNHGKIGNMENDDLKGNVYGGGRGVDEDENHQMSPSAGLVKGHTRVYINGGYISNSVFAGANMSAVWQEKVVNINGGIVKGSVFGGSKNVPLNRLRRGLKTVNVRNGHIYGNVYGCSQASRDGQDEAHPVLGDFSWTAFVNISGGLIDGNVHGAGYHSLVNGSTSIHIGKNAILYAKNHPENLYYNDRGGEEPDPVVNGTTTVEPKVDNPLIIHGSVYGGSDYYGSSGSNDWSHYDVNGITNMLIDGKGYNTTIDNEATAKYMSIDGGLYGCSTHCESGTLGRHIVLRNYGTRNVDPTDLGNEMTSASRTLTTIQRCNDLVIDNANVNLSGLSDITGVAHRNYAVLKVDDTLYMANASAFNLGTPTAPAYMDSIFAVRSLHLMNNDSVFADYIYKVAHRDWEWIGVAPSDPDGNISDTAINSLKNARLYYRVSDSLTALTYDKENVILFNGDSRLWVRYHKMVGGKNTQLYGELQGFFRMKSPFLPHGLESFAFARPKTTKNNNNLPQIEGQPLHINLSDGGFLSYEIWKNFFTQEGNYGGWYYPVEGNDGGTRYTRTKQYPYTNVLSLSRGVDVEEYREWIIPMFIGERWYVDGRGIGNGGWGMDKPHQQGWGHYPDMPKETVSGGAIAGDTLHMGGICYDLEPMPSDSSGYNVFVPEKDIIYVVGPISSAKENNTTTEDNNVTPTELNRWSEQYTLRLYRYPGNHKMSNDSIDRTVSTNPHYPNPETTAYTGFGFGPSSSTTHDGPGANVNSMLNVEEDASIIMDNVYMDGLFGYAPLEVSYHEIDTINNFKQELGRVKEPLVVTYPRSTLDMLGDKPREEVMIAKYGTVLRRGCNNLDAYCWYTDPDTICTSHQGGGIYVDELATVNVKELVTVDDNLQTLQYPDTTLLINCNVYLPTFYKHVWMTDTLTDGTDIGITSPIRNKAWHYVHNTFSPVAVSNKTGANDTIASLAYLNNNFFDDQEWFFVNNHRADKPKNTYYAKSIEDYEYNPSSTDNDVKQHLKPSETLFFGWTWNNVVRRQPTKGYLNTTTDNFTFDSINSPEDLAWLISLVNGLNRQVADSLSTVGTIKQTEDVDMKQYVWLPIGALKTGPVQFAGKYDGQGHLINHLDIAYIGLGDRRYERVNYGLYGGVYNGKLDRTFVTSGFMKPVGASNIGGLIGTLDGTKGLVSNSEASVDIHCFDNSESVSGGLVGVLEGGEIHSSMAMPILNAVEQGTLGGLVGKAVQDSVNWIIRNSFVNAKFNVGTETKTFKGFAGGMVGINYVEVTNCYMHLAEYSGLGANFGSLIGHSLGGHVSKCYASKQTYISIGDDNSQTEVEFPLSHFDAPEVDPYVKNCYRYTPVMGADTLGYMYYDNVVEFDETNSDQIPLFDTLNRWVDKNNTTSKYAYWARPTIPDINGDLPVLLLCDEDGAATHQGNFRSLATYNGGHSQTGAFALSDPKNPGVVLQYGGPIRDDNELDSALSREKVHATDKDYLFVYGDVINTINATLNDINETKGKVSVYEHAAIKSAGTLSGFDNTYVGVTFDNSCGHAMSTPGINHIEPSQPLPRDWHMFSTPLNNAPLGFDYHGHNFAVAEHSNFDGNPHDNLGFYNNPWKYLDHQVSNSTEFTWLNGGDDNIGNIRYWMKGWANSQSQKNAEFNQNDWVDGYFPSSIADKNEFGETCIPGAEEDGRYPYGMDMFCWYEPEPHWINFKRNGPNHWHSDESNPLEDQINHIHLHLPYTEKGRDNEKDVVNHNEDSLKIGKGYMFSIARKTYLQSHGKLNADYENNIKRPVTNKGKEHRGWNLVGNPYHAYLDFDKLQDANPSIRPFYVIYNADGFKGSPESAYQYYAHSSSQGGAYADKFLHPHQGFFIRTTNGAALKFNEGMTTTRALVDTVAYREWRPNYPLVNLYLSSEKGCADVTVVEFHRPEWGGAQKQKQLRQGNGLFYAYHDGEPYAALFTKEGATRVPLWFEPKDEDIFTISWDMANGDFTSLYLIDNLKGVQYDMLANDSYVFEGRKEDYASRFYITFECTDVEEHGEEVDNTFAFFDGSQWVVTGEGMLDLIDLQGRVLWRGKISGGQSRVSLPNVAKSIYLLRLVNSKETKIQKIIAQ